MVMRGRVLSKVSISAWLGAILFLLVAAIGLGAGTVVRVSTDTSGNEGNGHSSITIPALTADGSMVVFGSYASNLAPGDFNSSQDVFVKFINSGFTAMASTDASGNEGNDHSYYQTISADGRFVAFSSMANNLILPDTNAAADVFLKDLHTGSIERVSTDSSGGEADAGSYNPDISSNGRYVAFISYAGNLVPGDTNGVVDVFVKDTLTGSITRASTDAAGNEVAMGGVDPSISAGGRYVAFESYDANLVTGDNNLSSDIFVKDTFTGAITRVSTNSAGSEADANSTAPSISADGRYVAFTSWASNLVSGDTNGLSDIFIKDTLTGAVTRVSTDSSGGEANGMSDMASISADGRYIVFESLASDLVPGDLSGYRDVFAKDTLTGTVTRLSTDYNGNDADNQSYSPAISADGRWAAFGSDASDLVTNDTNGFADTFVAPTGAVCSPGKPVLQLGLDNVYWGSYQDYLDGILSIDYTVTNTGADPGFTVQVVDSTATNGVTCITPFPVPLGNIVAGDSAAFTMVYDIPTGVNSFAVVVHATVEDGCGTGYIYP
jgi:Tol biopolymer transport system component